MTPSEKLLSRVAIGTPLTSAEMNLLADGLKDRAMWSAQIQNIRHIQHAQRNIANMLDSLQRSDGALTTRASVVSEIMRSARAEGLTTGTDDLTDPASAARAALIADTNAGLAAGYTNYVASSTTGALIAYPAQELIRLAYRKKEREWTTRWTAAGGTLYQGTRMIALKTDPIWTAISSFNNPFPPFDYNSGMGVQDIPRHEAIDLGIIQPDYTPTSSPIANFNAHLEATITFTTPDDPHWQYLKSTFGDQIVYKDNRLRWHSELIDQMLATWQANPHTSAADTVRLGLATPRATSLAPQLLNRQIKLAPSDIGHIYNRHVGPNETDPRNLPLTQEELRLIPSVWRRPDHIAPARDGALDLTMHTIDHHEYHLIIAPNDKQAKGFSLKTFYKKKKQPVSGAEPA